VIWVVGEKVEGLMVGSALFCTWDQCLYCARARGREERTWFAVTGRGFERAFVRGAKIRARVGLGCVFAVGSFLVVCACCWASDLEHGARRSGAGEVR
jgi:hypothetical protein